MLPSVSSSATAVAVAAAAAVAATGCFVPTWSADIVSTHLQLNYLRLSIEWIDMQPTYMMFSETACGSSGSRASAERASAGRMCMP